MVKFFDVITIGGATQDIMYYTDDASLIKNNDIAKKEFLAFEYGSKIASENVNLTFGGGAMNTAVSLSLLNLKVSTILNLGSDWFGQVILKELKDKKIDVKNISFSKNLHSGFSFIVNYGNYKEHIIFTHRGSNKDLKLNEDNLKKLKTSWFYIASLSGSSNLVKKNLENIFKIASSKKIKIAWNPGETQFAFGYNFFKKYLKNVEFFNINKGEAIDLVLSSQKKTDDIEVLLKTIHSWGPKIVAITCGHNGAYVYDGNKIYYKPILKVKSVNTTGAGDAFGSSFVAGLIKYNYDIEKSLKLAITRSCLVITKIGAQVGLLKNDELKKFGL